MSSVFLCLCQLYFSTYVNCISLLMSSVFADCCQTWEHLTDPWPHFIGVARPCLVCCFYGRRRQRPRNAKSLRPTSFSNIYDPLCIQYIQYFQYIRSNDANVQYPQLCYQIDHTRDIAVNWRCHQRMHLVAGALQSALSFSQL